MKDSDKKDGGEDSTMVVAEQAIEHALNFVLQTSDKKNLKKVK